MAKTLGQNVRVLIERGEVEVPAVVAPATETEPVRVITPAYKEMRTTATVTYEVSSEGINAMRGFVVKLTPSQLKTVDAFLDSVIGMVKQSEVISA